MRKIAVVIAFLAASLIAFAAVAANNKVVADFTSQASSGVTGQVTLDALQQGGTMIHGRVAGLQTDVNYVSQVFTDGTCTSGSPTLVQRFHSNAKGMAVFTAKVDKSLTDIKSVSIQLDSDQSLKACAAVNQ